jgi:MarR family transcriptional regulator, organic hydroperoxide resistance regulator
MRLLWAVAHGLDSTSKRMRAELGVTGPQRLVLRLVGHYGQLSPGALAELLHIDPSSLTGILQRLESAGLLRRARDPVDGRRAILTLRKKGRDLNARRARTVEESVRRALSSLSHAKIEAARDVLKTLANELDDTAPRPSSGQRRNRRRRPRP